MSPIDATVHPTSLPTGVFLIISMFLVSLAFREAKKTKLEEALAGLKTMLRFAALHVALGTAFNLALTWFTLGPIDPSPESRARVTAFLVASGLNALFPALLGLGGVWFIFHRRNQADR